MLGVLDDKMAAVEVCSLEAVQSGGGVAMCEVLDEGEAAMPAIEALGEADGFELAERRSA